MSNKSTSVASRQTSEAFSLSVMIARPSEIAAESASGQPPLHSCAGSMESEARAVEAFCTKMSNASISSGDTRFVTMPKVSTAHDTYT